MSTATVSTNATWTSETSTFAWTAENEYVVIPGLSGDLTGAYLDLTIGGACRIDIVDTDDHVKTGGWNGYGRFGSAGSKTQDLEFMASGSSCDISKVKEVHIASTSASGSITIENVSYFYPVVPKFNSNGVATINLKSLVASDGLSFDPSTGVVTCDGTSGRLSLEFLSSGVNLTNLKRYDVTISGTDNIIWRSVMNSQGTGVLAYYGSRWGGNLTDAERAKAIAVNEFFWESKSTEEIGNVAEGNRTFTITSITLTADKMSVEDAHDVPIATLPHYTVAADGTVSQGSAISTSYGSAVDSPLGDGSDNNDEYIDISEYDELRIYTSKFDNTYPRVFFFNADPIVEGTSSTKGATVYLNDDIFSYNSTENYYYATITAIKGICNGLAKVIGVKKNSYSAPAITVSKIQVYKANPTYDFILSGQYSSATDVSAVTSSTTATAIDCSGLSGNDATITTGNPNCIFVAKSGVLANTNNVIVSGNCAQLALTDLKPFNAPFEFTATAAPTYNRTFTADKTTTVCLPFALTEEEASSLGTFYEFNSVDGSTMNFTSVATPAANTAYLVVPTATSITLSQGNKSIAATPASLATTKSDIEFIGTLEATTIPASGAEYSYFAYNNGELVKIVTNAATLPAFRAYFKVPTSVVSGARIAARFIGGSVTGINEVSKAQNFLNPDRKYIENGKIVIVKNGKKFNAAGAQIK